MVGAESGQGDVDGSLAAPVDVEGVRAGVEALDDDVRADSRDLTRLSSIPGSAVTDCLPLFHTEKTASHEWGLRLSARP